MPPDGALVELELTAETSVGVRPLAPVKGFRTLTFAINTRSLGFMKRNDCSCSDWAPSNLVMILAIVTLMPTGCRSSGLDVHLVRSATAKPGNVAVYFRVDKT